MTTSFTARMREYAEATRMVAATGGVVVIPADEIETWANVYDQTSREVGEQLAYYDRKYHDTNARIEALEKRKNSAEVGLTKAIRAIQSLQNMADPCDQAALRMAIEALILIRRQERETTDV